MVQKNCVKSKLIIICGPTASGKSAVAIECAKLLNSEVISADSMNVYKKFNIGTAKPSINEMEGIIHHLIDVVEPDSTFSVGDYKERALPIINDLLNKGKTPIICGGTGFYINSILYDLSYGNVACDTFVRNYYKDLSKKYGDSYVFNLLYKLDRDSALKIHCNDVKRVIRALEIYSNGRKKSDIIDSPLPKYDYNAYSIDYDREELYKRIDNRVDKMIENGLINEVKDLLKNGVSENSQAMEGIGYKEILGYIKGEYSLLNAIDLIKLNTKHYAKRQITFFKRLEGLKYVKPSNPKEIAERIVKEL